MSQNLQNGVYLISQPTGVDFAVLEELLKSGYVKIFQLRLKNLPTTQVIQIAMQCKLLCGKYNVLFIINDDIEVFKIVDCDGIHLGEDDIKMQNLTIDANFIKAFKKQNKIIGFSCYNKIDKAIHYASLGASYVSFGAVFKTKTKNAKTKARQNIILEYKNICKLLNINTPCCAIGGLNNKNISRMVFYGLNYACVISAIWNNKNPVKIAKKIAAKYK